MSEFELAFWLAVIALVSIGLMLAVDWWADRT